MIDPHSRVHRGTYRAQSRTDGAATSLGIAALENKIVQQAVVTILKQIYEEGFSYGFRGRIID